MDLDGKNKNPTLFIVSINLDCGNRVGRERLASVTSRHSRIRGLEREIAFCRSKANLNLSQNKSLQKREKRPRLPETDIPSNRAHRWRLKVRLEFCYFIIIICNLSSRHYACSIFSNDGNELDGVPLVRKRI